MVLRRTTYPQVAPRARDLVTSALAVVPRTLAIADAVEAAASVSRQRRRRVVLASRAPGGAWAVAGTDVLAHATLLPRLDRAPIATVLWGVPAVPASTPEVAVRRRLGPATPCVVVLDGERPLGAIQREAGQVGGLQRSAAKALDSLDPATREILAAAGRLGAAADWPVAVVGGVLRDLLLGRAATARRDLDVTVEGDAGRLARRLAETLGGVVREHRPFLTATVTLPDGRAVDVATARRERYRQPGALPEVEPATLAEDLGRRDFSVNAIAARLEAGAWGDVLDPEGGMADLGRGVIRVLQPLAFVEDPTRLFRAARFASRLGFRVDATTARLARAAAALDVYEALSGDRLGAELDAVLAEPDPADVLKRLLRLDAFRLLLPGYRAAPATAALVERVAARARAVPIERETVRMLYVLALTAALPPDAAEAWGERLALPAPARSMLKRAREDAPELADGLDGTPDAAEAYRRLRGTPEPVAAWTYVLTASARARRHLAARLGRWRTLRPLLSGDDLEAMGVAPGPRLGELLDGLRAAQAAGRVATAGEARAWVRRVIARGEVGANGSRPHERRRRV